jgi:hypothetical protein
VTADTGRHPYAAPRDGCSAGVLSGVWFAFSDDDAICGFTSWSPLLRSRAPRLDARYTATVPAPINASVIVDGSSGRSSEPAVLESVPLDDSTGNPLDNKVATKTRSEISMEGVLSSCLPLQSCSVFISGMHDSSHTSSKGRSDSTRSATALFEQVPIWY